ncbi:MAG: DEAD/DEAH box helicase [Proteobacteria bacterium]|nr:DEAD/DEAH box helicase [Pseudomonadota bacterium]MCP4920247.1 DEAD/DEAH box helicase [Pseudomonadota bacterium]
MQETTETTETEPVITGARVDDYKSGRRFEDFPISEEILRGLDEMGYTEATSVQAAAIEPGIAGKDLIVRAKTGTGKTTAFGIPIVERIEAGCRKPQGIVLSPTRELANQIARELSAIAKFKDIRILPIYGGVGMGPQEKALEEGVELIVGTPGRVADHIRRGNLDLSNIIVSALDEADEMLSMGFFKEVTDILRKAPKSAQTLLFSATVEADVKRLVAKFLKDPEDIMMSTDTDRVEGITHVLYESSPNFHKARALLAVIDTESPGSTIIFCNTREDTATVATFLDRQGLDAQLISGELPQRKREQVMAKVKSGAVQFLVATDVASRGIDISNLSHVINYALPGDPAVYMHRIGRTGRIGKKGTAITLAGGGDLATRLVLERQFQIKFEERVMPTADEANELRVERQVARIKSAMGTTAFEGFLGLVKALKDRPDGDMLLATALKGFFQYERDLRIGDGLDTVSAVQEAREEKRERKANRDGGGRRGGGGGRDRKRSDRPKSDRPRSEAKSDAPKSEGSGAPKRRRRRRKPRSGGSSES